MISPLSACVCVHEHVTVTAAGLSGWQTPVMLQPLHPRIKYDLRDLRSRISLVFLKHQGYLFMSVAKKKKQQLVFKDKPNVNNNDTVVTHLNSCRFLRTSCWVATTEPKCCTSN